MTLVPATSAQRFNGGTITAPLVLAPSDPNATALTINLPVGAGDADVPQILMHDENAAPIWHVEADAGLTGDATNWGGNLIYTLSAGRVAQFGAVGGTLTINGAGTIGFFGAAPVAQPTGVAVSAAGIHAALVTLGLITA